MIFSLELWIVPPLLKIQIATHCIVFLIFTQEMRVEYSHNKKSNILLIKICKCIQAYIQDTHYTMHSVYIITNLNIKNKYIVYKETRASFIFNTKCCIKIYKALTMSLTETFQRHKWNTEVTQVFPSRSFE